MDRAPARPALVQVYPNRGGVVISVRTGVGGPGADGIVATSLLQRVAAGDETAVRECLDRYGALVWSLARRMSPSQQDAEDAAQEIFLELWRKAPRFDPSIASETAFVAMIARRRLIDRRRAAQRRPEDVGNIAVEPIDEGAERRGEVCAEATFAARAMETLRPEQRQVLVLAACHGLSHEEISSSTGMPLGTVKTHVRRALMHVRDALLGRDVAEGSS
jgi:RNA polymerase sigma-70 factor (ECF subfamily)